jgi:PKHD-type hydroxylase
MNLLEKNENMTNYYFFRSALKADEIEEIHNISETCQEIDGNVSGQIDKSYRRSKIKWIKNNDSTRHIYKRLTDLMKSANKEMWNFHITTLEENLQFTEYNADEQGHYDWHMDFGGYSTSTRKLSMVVQLTDPSEYEGGKLQFMINRSVLDAPDDKGTVIFFPSYLTHRVTQLTKGKRNSLVFWFHGPTFI